MGGGRVFRYSTRRIVHTAQGVAHNVKVFRHKKLGSVVNFPKSAIKHEVRIVPNGGGKLGRSRDISAANRKMGKPARHTWENEFGEPYTWRHDTRRGVMQLVTFSIHDEIWRVGGNKLWYI